MRIIKAGITGDGESDDHVRREWHQASTVTTSLHGLSRRAAPEQDYLDTLPNELS